MNTKTYSLEEVLNPSMITPLPLQCEPAPKELEEVRRMFEKMEMRPSDVKTLDTYLKELSEIVHSPSKNGDNAMTSTFILDSIGPLMDKNNVNMEK